MTDYSTNPGSGIPRIGRDPESETPAGCRLYAEYWTDEPMEREWLIKDWIPMHKVGLLAGPGGAGKSRLALQLAAQIAAGGGQWIGPSNETIEGRALYATAEDDIEEMRRRLHEIGMADMVEHNLGVATYKEPLWGTAINENVGSVTSTGKWLRDTAEKFMPSLLVIDNVASSFAANENNRSMVRQFINHWSEYAQNHYCAVMLISHPPKGGQVYSGSTDWHNASRFVWSFGLCDDMNLRGKRKLEVIKNNYGILPEPLEIDWREGRWVSTDNKPASDPIEQRILDYLQGKATYRKNVIRNVVGRNESVLAALDRLIADGLVVQYKEGRAMMVETAQ